MPPERATIGIFDSGVGGLSVWREIVRELPGEDTCYVADQANVPYGSRPLEEVRTFAAGATRFLLQEGAGVVVVACNTASAAALYYLRDTFPGVPFVGMEPAVKPATQNTRSGVVGVIATPATFQGELFASLLERFATDTRVLTQICPGLVEAVEAWELDTPETASLLEEYLYPLLAAGADQIVLGCTHYPFLRPAIERLAGPGVTVIDPAPAVARQVRRVLARNGWEGPPAVPAGCHVFYTTSNPTPFAAIVGHVAGERSEVRRACWQQGELAPYST